MQAFAILVTTLSIASATPSGLSSAFLGAGSALRDGDYARAGEFHDLIRESGVDHLSILRDSLVSQVGAGDMADAIETATILHAAGAIDWLTSLCLFVESVRNGNHDEAEGHLAEYLMLIDLNRQISGEVPLVSTDRSIWTRANISTLRLLNKLNSALLRGWTELARGSMNRATEMFDSLNANETERVIGNFHKMLALAHVGDFESAQAINAEISGSGAFAMNRGYIEAHVQVLLQAGDVESVAVMLDRALNSYPAYGYTNVVAMRDRVEAGPPFEFDFIRSPEDGIAEVLHFMSSNFPSIKAGHFEMAHVRLAEYLRPDFGAATLEVGNIFRELGQFDHAAEVFASIGEGDPLYLEGRIGVSDVMLDSDDSDGAIALLQEMAETHPEIARVHSKLGHALRVNERHVEATLAYDEAVRLIPEPQQSSWFLYYSRGVSHERTGQWDEAEADFRYSLALSPDQPIVLNYLGYSLADMGIKLDESREMLLKAVEQRPGDGFIVDSLGWVYFRQGLFDDAVAFLEQASELDPSEPIINDHLGDAYWMVDRKREAESQWRRALAFGAEEKDATRIRRKLDVGLDTVLEEERSAVITVDNADQ